MPSKDQRTVGVIYDTSYLMLDRRGTKAYGPERELESLQTRHRRWVFLPKNPKLVR